MSKILTQRNVKQVFHKGIVVFDYQFIKNIPGDEVYDKLNNYSNWIITNIQNPGQFNLVKEKLKYAKRANNFTNYREEFPSIVYGYEFNKCKLCYICKESDTLQILNDEEEIVNLEEFDNIKIPWNFKGILEMNEEKNIEK